jgi:putative sugar O-methyltransferase
MKTPGDTAVLAKMQADYQQGPPVYHASKFWHKLNALNMAWLETDGIENFKRSINNNYFNWMVTAKSTYFRNMLRHYLKRNARHPLAAVSLFLTQLDGADRRCRTYTNERAQWSVNRLRRKTYGIYVRLLHDFVANSDTLGLFDQLEEPIVGNPVTITRNGRRISQDICNSYLEYLYIRMALADEFRNVRTLCEIGPGYGRLSYVLWRLAMSRETKIILVDIPPALYVAQWYLREVCANATFFMYRDFESFASVEQAFEAATICFLLPHQLSLLPDRYVDLIVNISSLHEMSVGQINNYYELIDRKARYFFTKQWLFWENPEDKMIVPAVIYPKKPSWRLVHARLNPVHSDFFEAVFDVTSGT